MSRAAGQFDRMIQFRVATVTTDEEGVEVESFADGVRAWARVMFGSGAERREASAAGNVQTATFRTLANLSTRSITRRDGIIFDGNFWGIDAISPVGPQGNEIEFTAKVRNG